MRRQLFNNTPVFFIIIISDELIRPLEKSEYSSLLRYRKNSRTWITSIIVYLIIKKSVKNHFKLYMVRNFFRILFIVNNDN